MICYQMYKMLNRECASEKSVLFTQPPFISLYTPLAFDLLSLATGEEISFVTFFLVVF